MSETSDPLPSLPLEAVICTELLQQRVGRPADLAAEQQSFDRLMHEMARPDGESMQKLAEEVLRLCRAGSAGISIVEQIPGGRQFRWHAIVGEWAPFLGGTMPYDASPCGVVVTRNRPLLMVRPQRHFHFPPMLVPEIEEALLSPFHVASQPAGTVWCVSHDPSRKFDAQNLRLLTALSKYASMAYLVHSLPEMQAKLDARLRG